MHIYKQRISEEQPDIFEDAASGYSGTEKSAHDVSADGVVPNSNENTSQNLEDVEMKSEGHGEPEPERQDNDKSKPWFVPRGGKYFEHDLRFDSDGKSDVSNIDNEEENDDAQAKEKKVAHGMYSTSEIFDRKSASQNMWSEAGQVNRWEHDYFGSPPSQSRGRGTNSRYRGGGRGRDTAPARGRRISGQTLPTRHAKNSRSDQGRIPPARDLDDKRRFNNSDYNENTDTVNSPPSSRRRSQPSNSRGGGREYRSSRAPLRHYDSRNDYGNEARSSNYQRFSKNSVYRGRPRRDEARND